MGRKASGGGWNSLQFSSSTTSYLATNLQPGTGYIWKVRSFCDVGWTETSPFTQNLNFTTATNREAANKDVEVKIYPNPFSENLTIEVDGIYERVTIYNINGATVMMKEAGGNSASEELQWSGRGADGDVLPEGIYYVKVETRGKIVSKSIVLTR